MSVEQRRDGGLHRPWHDHDGCGIGFVADASGQPSHRVLRLGLGALARLSHRGAVSADRLTGDGAGVLVQLPRSLFRQELDASGVRAEDLAVGSLFLWADDAESRAEAIATVEATIATTGLGCLGWRPVPVDEEALGELASARRPEILHLLVGRPAGGGDGTWFERRLYLLRRRIEKAVAAIEGVRLSIASLSHRTLVYKGMMIASQLDRFYPDLADPTFETALVLFHQRYSTNTAPAWALAQPFRFLAHNGEINTLFGNRRWFEARERALTSEVWGDELAELLPVLQVGTSDSGLLDNLLELLVMSGRDPIQAIGMLLPAAPTGLGAAIRDFYSFQSTLVEPWDGPAALVVSDGQVAVAALDRNGLRPLRYWVTRDGLVVVGSETGLVRLPEEELVRKGRVGPGELLSVDTGSGEVHESAAIRERLAAGQPYGPWLRRQLVEPPALSFAEGAPPSSPGLGAQLLFGYHRETVERILLPMAESGKPPTGSMGDDTPPAILSAHPQGLFRFFKQRFAQVTNPPIDSLRERTAMSLQVMVGPWGSLLDDDESRAHLIPFESPVLAPGQLRWLRELTDPAFRHEELSTVFPVGEDLRTTLERLARRAVEVAEAGATLLVLTDRGATPELLPVPMLLATSTVHQRLVEAGRRMGVSLVVDSGAPCEDHDVACLLGFGATLVHPWLAYETVVKFGRDRALFPVEELLGRYHRALERGLLKIMARMGIGPLVSYQGAQLFEGLGLDPELVEAHFRGTECRLSGVGLEAIERAVRRAGEAATRSDPDAGDLLPDRGFYRYRRRGEAHAFSPQVVRHLHRAVRSGDAEAWSAYREATAAEPPTALRDLLGWHRSAQSIPLDEVESAEQIVRRFTTGAMSHGALSRECHETIAVAMNRLGARSNSGEGGEAEERLRPYAENGPETWFAPWRPGRGDWGNSAIKQVASGRFGVTADYLMSAREIEIKMAQGAKPGEGGQIPGHKVSPEIATIRRSVPGVTLISPPPHHDIYSIEDLAQLIYDLKSLNPRARVGVKLSAQAGVGVVAAGVAKGYADGVTIAGGDGGTGASPLSSLKHAGSPWEMGLAEAQQVLVARGLRGRVTLRVEGGVKTGRDVVLAALLGADEVGFGTAALVSVGCIMARQCHLNTCPVGIATQRPELRDRFPGTPEHVVAFMLFVAEEVRHHLADLGFSRFEDVIGRVDLLAPREEAMATLPHRPDLGPLLWDPDPARRKPRRCLQRRNDRPEDSVPLGALVAEDCEPSVLSSLPFHKRYQITNRERSVGARLAGAIASARGSRGLPEGLLRLDFRGSAGQSFGAFCTRGMKLLLEGDAQDSVGKGMSGGQIIVRPPAEARFTSHENAILGNAVLYGATGGSLYAAGRAGERFAVRNSGARAVVEGCGDHACEYMTGGVVVVLGSTGQNVGAGMSGGLAFVLDLEGDFEGRVNRDMVALRRISGTIDETLLRRLVERHLVRTGSQRAGWIVNRWEFALRRFWKVCPAPRQEDATAQEQDLDRLEVEELSRLAADR